MCCQRCIEAVEHELVSLGLKVKNVSLGKAVFAESPDVASSAIEKSLKKRGFELIISEEEQLVEVIKIAVITLIHNPDKGDKGQNMHLSSFIEEQTSKPYRQLNKLFSKHAGLTIEKYAILQRIEKVKELIQENKYNFSEIADLIGYKTQQHLSGQFKRITGMSMQTFKSKGGKRKHIDVI